jgi:hypothetical protein
MLCHRLSGCTLKSGPRVPLAWYLKTRHKPGLQRARAVGFCAAALLVPFLSAADSYVETRAKGAALRATAHVDFKIIIPRILALDLASGDDRIPGTHKVGILSNSRSVTLAATVSASDEARGHVILNAAARKIILQDAACTTGLTRLPNPVVCTVSMP